ncbi:MAG: hypothetical protein AAF539_09190, partial [Planctomycetota bacterium]
MSLRCTRAIAFFVSLSLIAKVSGWGQDARPPAEIDLQVEVPIWVDELDADNVQTRARAQQQLMQAGPEASEHVPVITSHLSIEAKQRLDRVRQAWRQAKTKRESTEVLIRFRDAKTVSEALEVISTASEVEFELDPRVEANVMTSSINLPTGPLGFWYAIDWVLDRTNLDINFYGGDRTALLLTQRAEGRPSRVDSAAYGGIYRLEPTVVTARRVLASSESSGLNVTLTIAWQPGRQPIGLSIPVREIHAVLSDDQTLVAEADTDSIEIATSSELNQSEFYLPLTLPTSSPEKIRRISGMIQAMLPGRRAAFSLDLDSSDASSSIDAMTVRVEEVRRNGPLHEVRVGVEFDDSDRSLENHRQWIFENEAFVRLPDETRLDHLGYETFRQTATGIGIG